MIEWGETSEVLASQMTALQFHMSHEQYVSFKHILDTRLDANV